jgi:lipopolysaccharide export system permease protein
MSQLDRYLLRELLQTVGAILLVLCLIMASLMFVKLLEKVALGDMNPQVVLPLMGLQVVRYLARSMPAAFFVSVLLVLGRMYRDGEMTALAACGVGGLRIYRSLGVALLPLVAITLWMAVWLQPWTSAEIERIKIEQQQEAAELAGIQAGRFNEFRNGDLVLYVEQLDEDSGHMLNLFIQSRQHGKLGLATANRGEHSYDPASGDHFVVLREGRRYEGAAGRGDFQEVAFQTYTLRIAEGQAQRGIKRNAVPSLELYRSADVADRAELWERLSFPLSLITLTLVAIPLSRSLPRQTVYTRMLFAFLVYFAYVNLSGVSVSWMKKGVTPEWLGIWWVQLLFLLLALLFAALDSRWLRRAQRWLKVRLAAA